MNNPTTTKRLCIGEDARGCRVTLELEIEHHKPEHTTTGAEIVKRTIDLQPVTEYKRLSICGETAGSGGQMQDTIRKELDDYKRLFVDKARILRILDIWDTYHLNDINAGTRTQQQALDIAMQAPRAAETARRDHYDWAVRVLKGLAADPYAVEFEYRNADDPEDPNNGKWLDVPDAVRVTREHAEARAATFSKDTGRATRVVPVGNLYEDNTTDPQQVYQYGSAWLVAALPPEIEAEALQLFEQSEVPPVDAQTGGLPGFIHRNRLQFEARRVDSRPDKLMDDPGQRHWRCTIIRPANRAERQPRRTMGLYFSQGSAHTEAPTITDVLGCIQSDCQGYDNARDFNDWCAEYGYDTDSRKAERIFKAIERQAEQLKRLLGEDQFNEWLEIPGE